MISRPVHKNLFGISKCYILIDLRVFSFIKFQEPPILQGRIHWTELPESGFGHNVRLECTSDLKYAFLNCILRALSRDTPLVHLSCHLAQSTWHLEIQVPGAGTWHITKTWQVGFA